MTLTSRWPTSRTAGVASPGTRLPHLWLAGLSTLVRDGRYLLLNGPDGRAWAQATREADPTGAVLDVALLRRTDRCGIGENGALLVRPDHVTAWRATHATPHALADTVAQSSGLPSGRLSHQATGSS
ncbi:hypothetical protein [Nonomuraea sp. NPDC049400]|uniref:aromatic-ring hydroxylase C-terminal domain-containing protein n=1 Tax=Nonomuraea sp. NPDC049400 TaxID=3364352 RepID=UPI0037A8322F